MAVPFLSFSNIIEKSLTAFYSFRIYEFLNLQVVLKDVENFLKYAIQFLNSSLTKKQKLHHQNRPYFNYILIKVMAHT